MRNVGYHSAGTWKLKTPENGTYRAWPIVDWKLADVWKAIKDNDWDYCRETYDVMLRAGMRPQQIRVGPPTMITYALPQLQTTARASPQWFERVCHRCPGVRSAALFGKRAIQPERRYGETWQHTFQRECIDRAPAPWIAERSERCRGRVLAATTPTARRSSPT